MNKTQINGVNFINCTPHAITFIAGDNEYEIKPSGHIARIKATEEQITELFTKITYGAIEGLANIEEDTYYIVSSMVLNNVSEEEAKYLVAPNTNSAIRDEQGHIKGVTSFVKR